MGNTEEKEIDIRQVIYNEFLGEILIRWISRERKFLKDFAYAKDPSKILALSPHFDLKLCLFQHKLLTDADSSLHLCQAIVRDLLSQLETIEKVST